MYLHAFSVPLAGSTNQRIRIRPLRTARKGEEDTIQIVGAGGDKIVLTLLREEVVTLLAGPIQVLHGKKGIGGRPAPIGMRGVAGVIVFFEW